MTFAQLNLDPQIAKALNNCGYTQPTPIQSRCIPDILQGRDVVASAQTGTGKTAAFMLPALQHLSKNRQSAKPRILVLTPTRELSTQIMQAAIKYGKFLRFNMANLVGGMSYRQQIRDLSRAVDIIVATPGRLMDHMENRRVDLSGIEMLILDEADRMLDMGFIEDVQYIASQTSKQRQTLLFSATVDGNVSRIVKNLLKDPIRIDLSNEKMAPTQIQQVLYMADSVQHKNRLLQHFLKNGNIFKGIIFSATKIMADRLANDLCAAGFKAVALHGDLKQAVRNRTIESMRRNKVQFLVATDVASRGIDISDITHVINYDLPRFCEDYVHRIGRTGRAGKTGIAISFAMSTDARHLQKIERFTNQKLQREVVVGLEPSKNMQASPAGKKKKFSKSFSKNGFGGKKEFSRNKPKGKSFGSRSSDQDFSRDSYDKPKKYGQKNRSSDVEFSRGPFDKDKSFGRKNRSSDSDFSERSAKKRNFDSKNRSSDMEFSHRSSGKKSFGSKNRSSDTDFSQRPSGKKSFGSKNRTLDLESSHRASGKKSFGSKNRSSDADFSQRPSGKKSFGSKNRSSDADFSQRPSGKKSFGSQNRSFDIDFSQRPAGKKSFGSKNRSSDMDFSQRPSGKKSFGSKNRSSESGNSWSKKPKHTSGKKKSFDKKSSKNF